MSDHVSAAKQAQQQPIPLDKSEQIFQRISDLKISMQAKSPGYEALLQVIHRNLVDDNDVVTLLSPEQMGTIFAALSMKKSVIIAKAASSKSKTSSGKKLTEISIDEL